MINFKKLIATMLCASLMMGLAACGKEAESETKKLTIAYQGGIGYAPVHVMEV